MGKKKKVYDVDMDGIYKNDLVICKDLINKHLLKKYKKSEIIEKIKEEKDENKKSIKHLLRYLENDEENIFTIRREPNNKSKLWGHITSYTLEINSAIALFD